MASAVVAVMMMMMMMMMMMIALIVRMLVITQVSVAVMLYAHIREMLDSRDTGYRN
jgi:hypothetical protein